MTSTRSNDLKLCLICGDKKVTVNGRSETGIKLITNLLRCLSLSNQLKSNGDALENINLCFKCKYALEEWSYAQEEAGSGFLANRARQIKAGFLVKILETFRDKSSVSSASTVSERIRLLIYERFNVIVNVDRLEPSAEQIQPIFQEELISHKNHSDSEQSDSSESQDDLDDDRSYAASSSDVEILEDEDDEDVEILPKKTSRARKLDNDDSCQVISSETNDPNSNLGQQTGQDNAAGQHGVDPVQTFQLKHPIPPDFVPKKHKPGSYLYGKCCAMKEDNNVKCCECSESVPLETHGFSSWWKIRNHMRQKHPERVPCHNPFKDIELKSIGGDKYKYGQVTVTKFLESNLDCYKCDACGNAFRTKTAKHTCMQHIRRRHPNLAPFNPYFQGKIIHIKKNLIRYAAAYLVKKSDREIICQVCSHVSRAQRAQKNALLHVRQRHSVLAPIEISTTLKTNFEAVQGPSTEMVRKIATSLEPSAVSQAGPSGPSVRKKRRHEKPHPVSDVSDTSNDSEEDNSHVESNEPAGQDGVNPIERFQLKHPIPPDFIPDKHKSGSYIYGKCIAKEEDSQVKCCECSESVSLETNGVYSWWQIRDHMRKKHPELVPCHNPFKDIELKSIGGDKYQYGQVTVTKFLESDLDCYKCDACGNAFRTKSAKHTCMQHIRRRHPGLAPFNPYFQGKIIHIDKNLIRYGAAHLVKKSDTEIECQVCSFVTKVQKYALKHVRVRHSVLAPIEISTTLKTNFEAVQSRSTEMVKKTTTSPAVSSVSHAGPSGSSVRKKSKREKPLPVSNVLESSEDSEEDNSDVESNEPTCQDDLDDDRSYAVSSSDVEMLEDEDDEDAEILPKKTRTSRSTKLDDDGECQVISETVDPNSNLVQQTEQDQGHQAHKSAVDNFKLKYPIPPDFIPNKHEPGSYLYGKCCAKEEDNQVKCCECSESVPKETDGVSSWWKIREHMRTVHSERVPCISPPTEKRLQSKDKYQYGQATMTKVVESGREHYTCDICRSKFEWKIPVAAFINHVQLRHPELARFNPYCQEKPVFLKKNLIRYAGAYLKKISDKDFRCQVCSVVSTGKHAQKSSISHVRRCHSDLAPVQISATLQTNSGPSEVQSNEPAGQDGVDPVEKFQLKHPVPPDFIPDGNNSENYTYGKCRAKEEDSKVECCECSLSVPKETAGVSPWWRIREHMRMMHSELVPRIAPVKDQEVKCIGEHKFQYRQATMTRFLESHLESYECDTCGETFRTKFAKQCCMGHIRTHHPELARPNAYFHEKAVFVTENLIRYAAAYLEKQSDTKVKCQVCSFVSTGQHAQKSSILHVRVRHAALAPVESSASLQTNFQRVQAEDSEDDQSEGESNEPAGQDGVDPVETFQLKHPIPPDFIPQKHKPGSYLYGKCYAMEDENEAKCCKCLFSVPLETEGVSSWWKIREHMRKEHPELVPCILPVRELEVKSIGEDKFQYGQATFTKFMESDVECYKCDACGQEYKKKFARKCCMDHIRSVHPDLAPFNPFYHEKAIFVNKDLIRYAATYLEKLSDTEFRCQVCSYVSVGQHAQKASISHVRTRHSALAPVEISAILQKNSEPVQGGSGTEMVQQTPFSLAVSHARSSRSSVRKKRKREKPRLVSYVLDSEEENSEVEPNDPAGQDGVDPLIETFQLTHPVPPDFIPNKDRAGNCYSYGKCNAAEDENQVKCSECSFSVPVETEGEKGLSAWWAMRGHMRMEHLERVPCIRPPTERRIQKSEDEYQYGQATMTKVIQLDEERYSCDICRSTFGAKHAKIAFITHVRRRHPELANFNPYFQEKPVVVKKNLIRYAGAYLKTVSDTEAICQVCSLVVTGIQPDASARHVRLCHSVLAPVVIGLTYSDEALRQKIQRNSTARIQAPGSCAISNEAPVVIRAPPLTDETLRQAIERNRAARIQTPGSGTISNEFLRETIRRNCIARIQARASGVGVKDVPHSRAKRKHASETSKNESRDGKGSACDQDSTSSSSSDESDEYEEEVFIPIVNKKDRFECPLCGDRRDLKSNFILHLKWHAGDVDQDSPREC